MFFIFVINEVIWVNRWLIDGCVGDSLRVGSCSYVIVVCSGVGLYY